MRFATGIAVDLIYLTFQRLPQTLWTQNLPATIRIELTAEKGKKEARQNVIAVVELVHTRARNIGLNSFIHQRETQINLLYFSIVE